MTPKGMTKNEIKHQQLRLIDSYLIGESGKATLKSAFKVIKPLYLQYVDKLLQRAGDRILAELQADDT